MVGGIMCCSYVNICGIQEFWHGDVLGLMSVAGYGSGEIGW